MKHLLLRVNDSADIKTSELKARRMETHLTNMETRINAGIDKGLLALEHKVDTQLEEVKEAVGDILKTLRHLAPSQEPCSSSDEEVEITVIPTDNCLPIGNHLQAEAPSPYESRLEERLNMLDAKVDTQFGRLLDMMREVLSVSRWNGSLKA